MKYEFTANAVRWFDRANGNTYHSVRITDNETGNTIYCPYQYGYDEHYRQTALVAMRENNWIPEKYTADLNDHKTPSVFMYERENNYPINWIVSDGLKRDCIKNGKE
jgi:hypothetical protein